MVENGVVNNMDDILEAGYHQSHHPIKDNIENKQRDKIEKLLETGNRNNSIIRPYRGRYPCNI